MARLAAGKESTSQILKVALSLAESEGDLDSIEQAELYDQPPLCQSPPPVPSQTPPFPHTVLLPSTHSSLTPVPPMNTSLFHSPSSTYPGLFQAPHTHPSSFLAPPSHPDRMLQTQHRTQLLPELLASCDAETLTFPESFNTTPATPFPYSSVRHPTLYRPQPANTAVTPKTVCYINTDNII